MGRSLGQRCDSAAVVARDVLEACGGTRHWSGGAALIRHKPFGSGHPYSVDTEQRYPIDPIAGQPVTIGARTSGEVGAVRLEISISGGAVETRAATPAVRS